MLTPAPMSGPAPHRNKKRPPHRPPVLHRRAAGGPFPAGLVAVSLALGPERHGVASGADRSSVRYCDPSFLSGTFGGSGFFTHSPVRGLHSIPGRARSIS